MFGADADLENIDINQSYDRYNWLTSVAISEEFDDADITVKRGIDRITVNGMSGASGALCCLTHQGIRCNYNTQRENRCNN